MKGGERRLHLGETGCCWFPKLKRRRKHEKICYSICCCYARPPGHELCRQRDEQMGFDHRRYGEIDIGYADQSVNQDYITAERRGRPGNNTSSRDKYGALSWGAGETRLNFLVKGPDTWGAKTSAFVEFDFRSMTSNAVSCHARSNVEDYGLANLRHAFMKFDWPTFSIVAGRTWSVPGVQPCFCLLDVNELGPFNKGGSPDPDLRYVAGHEDSSP